MSNGDVQTQRIVPGPGTPVVVEAGPSHFEHPWDWDWFTKNNLTYQVTASEAEEKSWHHAGVKERNQDLKDRREQEYADAEDRREQRYAGAEAKADGFYREMVERLRSHNEKLENLLAYDYLEANKVHRQWQTQLLAASIEGLAIARAYTWDLDAERFNTRAMLETGLKHQTQLAEIYARAGVPPVWGPYVQPSPPPSGDKPTGSGLK